MYRYFVISYTCFYLVYSGSGYIFQTLMHFSFSQILVCHMPEVHHNNECCEIVFKKYLKLGKSNQLSITVYIWLSLPAIIEFTWTYF